MTQHTELSAELRTGTGKGFARKLRHRGKIPAILYGSKNGCISLSVNQADLKQALKAGSHTLIQININGDKRGKRLVMLKEIQDHPIKTMIYHVDFYEVSEKQKVEVALPIILKGEAIGVKSEAGILEHVLRELHIECPANAIPEHIEVDISELSLGRAVHVEELSLDKKITVKDDPSQTVVCVVAPKAEEEKIVEEEVEGEEGAVAEGKEAPAEQETGDSGD
jgi:large subunit ribosomal protein L25